MSRSRRDPAESLLSRISISESGCWLWEGRLDRDGYGVFWARVGGGRPLGPQAHRVSYQLLVGPIPVGLVIDHTCKVKACICPDHLEPVTNHENVVVRGSGPSAINARKTHCLRGHEFNEDNTYWYKDGRARSCKACQKLRQQIRRRSLHA